MLKLCLRIRATSLNDVYVCTNMNEPMLKDSEKCEAKQGHALLLQSVEELEERRHILKRNIYFVH
jgi:hypothetical protein